MAPLNTIPSVNSNFNTGADGQLVTLIDQNGNPYALGKVMNFTAKPEYKDVSIEPINYGGRQLNQTERVAYKGTITVARENGALEQLEFTQQQRKRQGQPELYFTVKHQIFNPDGSNNEFIFTNARVRLSDPGEYRLGSAVEMKIDFTAEDKIPLS